MTPQELRNQMLQEAGIDPTSWGFQRPGTGSTVQASPSQGSLPIEPGQVPFGPKTRFSQYANNANDWAAQKYADKRQFYGIGDDLDPRSFNVENAINTGKKGLAAFDPRTAVGKRNYGGGLLSAGLTTVGSLASGEDVGDSLARGAGAGVGTTVLGAAGTALGTGLMPFVAATPLAPIAPFLPTALGFAGSWIGGDKGADVGGGLWNSLEGDNKKQEAAIEGLGDYAKYLNPDSQKALAEYMAFTGAQQGMEQDSMAYLTDLEMRKFDAAARTKFENDAAMATLNNAASMARERQSGQMEMIMNNSNNFWNGYNSNADMMSRIYAS